MSCGIFIIHSQSLSFRLLAINLFHLSSSYHSDFQSFYDFNTRSVYLKDLIFCSKNSEKISNPNHFNTFFNKIRINDKGQMLSHLPFVFIRSISVKQNSSYARFVPLGQRIRPCVRARVRVLPLCSHRVI